MKITYKEFEKYIRDIQRYANYIDDLNDVCYKYKATETSFGCSILIDDMVELLERATNDTEGWISYWVFELHLGEYYTEGDVKDTTNGKNVPLKTVKDLWRLLNDLL